MMSDTEKEHLVAKQRAARCKQKAEGRIPPRKHVPRTGLALARQQEGQRVYQAGRRRKMKSTATATAAHNKPVTISTLCKGEELVQTAGPHQSAKDARYKWAGDKAVFIGYLKV